jgi:hypothetical protein
MANEEHLNSAKPNRPADPWQFTGTGKAGLGLLAHQTRALAIVALLLAICFAKRIYDLCRFAIHSELFSYILLIPFISL